MATGQVPISIMDVAGADTIPEHKGMILVRASTAYGSYTLALPTVANAGMIWVIKATDDAGKVSFTGTVNGVAGAETLNNIGDTLIVTSDGAIYYHPNRTLVVP
ncbi:MAG: hypothetical protein GY851_35355 [bacterium]|nr:hypothetical protein [bacterium]